MDKNDRQCGRVAFVCISKLLLTETKKKSLTGALKKKFGRIKDGNRAQSAERIPAHYDSNLLQPPGSLDTAASTSRISGV